MWNQWGPGHNSYAHVLYVGSEQRRLERNLLGEGEQGESTRVPICMHVYVIACMHVCCLLKPRPQLSSRQDFYFSISRMRGTLPGILHLDSRSEKPRIDICICCIFLKHIRLKRPGFINIFCCPVTMEIGSADIILNLIFPLPQCASLLSRIIEIFCASLSLPLSPAPQYIINFMRVPPHDPTEHIVSVSCPHTSIIYALKFLHYSSSQPSQNPSQHLQYSCAPLHLHSPPPHPPTHSNSQSPRHDRERGKILIALIAAR